MRWSVTLFQLCVSAAAATSGFVVWTLVDVSAEQKQAYRVSTLSLPVLFIQSRETLFLLIGYLYL